MVYLQVHCNPEEQTLVANGSSRISLLALFSLFIMGPSISTFCVRFVYMFPLYASTKECRPEWFQNGIENDAQALALEKKVCWNNPIPFHRWTREQLRSFDRPDLRMSFNKSCFDQPLLARTMLSRFSCTRHQQRPRFEGNRNFSFSLQPENEKRKTPTHQKRLMEKIQRFPAQ